MGLPSGPCDAGDGALLAGLTGLTSKIVEEPVESNLRIWKALSGMSEFEIFAVILAGGSGTRFWPASRRLRPKQLLPLGPSAPQSLIAATAERLGEFVPSSHLLVSTGSHLVEATKRELPHLPQSAFLAEPMAKNTAPCIAWAAAEIFRRNPRGIVCVVPSDQHAADTAGFVATLRQAVRSAQGGSITTIGIVPTRAETGYGYIQLGKAREGGGFQVGRFVEKPDSATAATYLASGDYLWNAGIFVFRAGDMLQAIERNEPGLFAHLTELQQNLGGSAADRDAAILRYFEACRSVSIDYAVMEKESNLTVVPGSFGWSDLGSWQSAWELSPRDEQGNAGKPSTVFVDAYENLVEDLRSQAGQKTIALVGVSGLCVVETEDALLVMPRERSQDVRLVVQALKERQQGDLT